MSNETDPVPAPLRRERIVSLLEERGFVRVADMSREFGVSEVTVRSDLSVIEGTHRIDRVHGGAVMRADFIAREESFEKALSSSADAKRRIGQAAAALVTSGSSLLIDVGTTPAAVADALLERDDLVDVVIVTNSLTTALALEPAIPRFTVVVTGGTLRPLQHSLVAPYATQLLDEFHVDLAFLGGTGVDPVGGVTNVNLAETELKRRMLRAADRAVIVADASKLGVVDLARIGTIEEFGVLVTSANDPDRDDEVDTTAGLDALTRQGLDVIVA